jgi:hypothetical protein
VDGGVREEGAGEVGDDGLVEVDDEAFGDEGGALCAFESAGEEVAAGDGVRQVDRLALEAAARLFASEQLLFLRNERRQVGLHP